MVALIILHFSLFSVKCEFHHCNLGRIFARVFFSVPAWCWTITGQIEVSSIKHFWLWSFEPKPRSLYVKGPKSYQHPSPKSQNSTHNLSTCQVFKGSKVLMGQWRNSRSRFELLTSTIVPVEGVVAEILKNLRVILDRIYEAIKLKGFIQKCSPHKHFNVDTIMECYIKTLTIMEDHITTLTSEKQT